MKLLSITKKEFNLFLEILKGEKPEEAFNLSGVSPIDKLSIYNQLVKISK
ncbi:hypothetical protein [Fusobacterium polymorphum]